MGVKGIPEEFELEDIAEQAELVGKLTPKEYAKLRGKSPQLIYYYIRTKVIQGEICVCGRSVIDVVQADTALQAKAVERGKVLDTRPDAERECEQGDAVQELSPSDPLE